MPDRDDKTDGSRDDVSEFVQGIMKTLGRGAGKAREIITNLGERGAAALALHKLETERDRLLQDLGIIARRTLAASESLSPDHKDAAPLVRIIGRLEEKIARLGSGGTGGASGANDAGGTNAGRPAGSEGPDRA